MDSVQRILVLAPHPDDGEFGCGATLHKLADQGKEIYYAAFTPCLQSVPEGFEKDVLYKELYNATSQLGIKAENIRTYDFNVRYFPRDRQKILETLIDLRKIINPDLIFIPNSTDVHQDHNTMHHEGIRAFKHRKILGYELPWNNYTVTTNFHIEVSAENIKAKLFAVQSYKSQKFRNYANANFLESIATVRGTQIGKKYAEAFEMIHWVV